MRISMKTNAKAIFMSFEAINNSHIIERSSTTIKPMVSVTYEAIFNVSKIMI